MSEPYAQILIDADNYGAVRKIEDFVQAIGHDSGLTIRTGSRYVPRHEYEALQAQLDEANEKLRWRIWPDEKPSTEQFVLIKESVYQYVCDDFGGEAWQEVDCGNIYDCEDGDLWLPIPTSESGTGEVG